MNRILILVVGLLVGINSHAINFILRPQAGVNFTNWSNSPNDIDFKTRAGLQLGIDGQFGNRFYVQTGLFYNETKTFLESESEMQSAELFVDFYSVSLGAGYKLIDPKITDMFNVRIFTIGYYSWEIGVNPRFQDLTETENLNQLNWGVGAGIDFWHFFLEVSGDIATRRVFDSSSMTGLEDLKLNLIRVAVGGRIVF